MSKSILKELTDAADEMGAALSQDLQGLKETAWANEEALGLVAWDAYHKAVQRISDARSNLCASAALYHHEPTEKKYHGT